MDYQIIWKAYVVMSNVNIKVYISWIGSNYRKQLWCVYTRSAGKIMFGNEKVIIVAIVVYVVYKIAKKCSLRTL